MQVISTPTQVTTNFHVSVPSASALDLCRKNQPNVSLQLKVSALKIYPGDLYAEQRHTHTHLESSPTHCAAKKKGQVIPKVRSGILVSCSSWLDYFRITNQPACMTHYTTGSLSSCYRSHRPFVDDKKG